MPFLKSSQITGLSPKPLDVTGFTQSASENLEGTYSQHEVLLADAFNVTDNVTISDNLILAKLSDDGNAITVTGNASTTRTISGSGSLEGSTFAQTPNVSLTGMTGAIGSAVTGTLGSGVTGGSGLTGSPNLNLVNATFPAGHVVQTVTNTTTSSTDGASSSAGVFVLSSGMNVVITPKFSNSKIILNFNTRSYVFL